MIGKIAFVAWIGVFVTGLLYTYGSWLLALVFSFGDWLWQPHMSTTDALLMMIWLSLALRFGASS